MAISQEEALRRITEYVAKKQAGGLDPDRFLDPVTWAEERFYVPDQRNPESIAPDKSVRGPIILMPHQKTLLRFMMDMSRPMDEYPQNILFSTIKKSGKTSIVSLISRWIAETWGDYSEVILVGNDADQARSRIFEGATKSIELDPMYNIARRELMDTDGYTEWRIIRSGAQRIPNNGLLRPIACDYKGEAGANQAAACFTEIWGAVDEKMRRLVNELTPPPTRRSVRIFEGYAGFENESILWREFWDLAQKEGRKVSRDEFLQYGEWPFEDDPPVWVNEPARLVAYIDQGLNARRMPWQLGAEGEAYYRSQAASNPPAAFDRLHLNHWTSSVSEFIPSEWWDSCYRSDLPQLDVHTPIVLGVDAAVTGDCSAITGVCRAPWDNSMIQVLFCYVWSPEPGKSMDYGAPGGLDETLRMLCSKYDVAEVTYDSYQLHHLMTNMVRDNVANCKSFNQNADRLRADKMCYDVIRDRRIVHPGIPVLKEHIQNAAAKQAKDEDTKLRIIKREASRKVDALVAMSMAVSECYRLLLE